MKRSLLEGRSKTMGVSIIESWVSKRRGVVIISSLAASISDDCIRAKAFTVEGGYWVFGEFARLESRRLSLPSTTLFSTANELKR